MGVSVEEGEDRISELAILVMVEGPMVQGTVPCGAFHDDERVFDAARSRGQIIQRDEVGAGFIGGIEEDQVERFRDHRDPDGEGHGMHACPVLPAELGDVPLYRAYRGAIPIKEPGEAGPAAQGFEPERTRAGETVANDGSFEIPQ